MDIKRELNHFIGNFVLMTLHAASAFISRINSNNALGLQNRQRLLCSTYKHCLQTFHYMQSLGCGICGTGGLGLINQCDWRRGWLVVC